MATLDPPAPPENEDMVNMRAVADKVPDMAPAELHKHLLKAAFAIYEVETLAEGKPSLRTGPLWALELLVRERRESLGLPLCKLSVCSQEPSLDEDGVYRCNLHPKSKDGYIYMAFAPTALPPIHGLWDPYPVKNP